MKGALNKVTNAAGGYVQYDYHTTGLTINHSDRALNITAPGGYAEPRVFIEQDFAVVTWRQMSGSTHDPNERPIAVYAYSWEGKWRETYLGTAGNVKLINNNQDFQLVAGRDFFSLLRNIYGTNNYSLYTWHKDERIPGGWLPASTNPVTIDLASHDLTKEQLFAGNNFFAVSNSNGKIFRYVWNGLAWVNSIVTESVNTHFTTAANNFILSHNTSPNPDVLTLYYLDETKTWQSKSLTANFNSGVNSYWYSSNGINVGMIDGTTEYIVRWDENYNLNSYNTGFSYLDNSKVFVVNESNISIIEDNGTNPDKIRSMRFDGNSWYVSNEISVGNSWDSSFGDDFFIWKTLTDKSRRRFDPNLSTWSSDFSVPRSTSNPAWRAYPLTGINNYFLEGEVYNRTQNGSWNLAFATPIATNYSLVYGYMGYNYLAYVTQKSVSDPIINRFVFFRNNQIVTQIEKIGWTPFAWDYLAKAQLTSPTTLVLTAESNSSNTFSNSTTLIIDRVLNYSIEGKINDFPIIKATTNDGMMNRYVSYDYDIAKATCDPGGSSARFNKATSVPGSSTTATKPYGYSETYFFNTLSETELGDTFPDESPSLGITAAKNNYKLATGTPYRTRVYNSSGTLVSESSTIYSFPFNPIYDAATQAKDVNSLLLVNKSISSQDQIETVSQLGYNTKLQVNYKKEFTNQSLVNTPVEYFYTYAWENYASCLSQNILSPVIQSKRQVTGTGYTESSVSRWKDWTCAGSNCLTSTVPAPTDQYTWKTTNAPTFTWWDVATQTPSSDWVFGGGVTARDNTCGGEIELKGNANQKSAQLYDLNKRSIIASVSNAGLSQFAYTGFEDASTGNWTIGDGTYVTGSSKTGNRYLNLGTIGLTISGLSTTEKYTVSFWVIGSGGSVVIDGVGTVPINQSTWDLVEYTVTGLGSLNLKSSGGATVQIDDVRLVPARASMSTSTYHPLFGATSQTDANNQTLYSVYDDFGRLKNTLDEKSNIVKANQYNFKKQ
jgi:hypothetical protein